MSQASKLVFSAVGLQGSYLIWGALQERVSNYYLKIACIIMTRVPFQFHTFI